MLNAAKLIPRVLVVTGGLGEICIVRYGIQEQTPSDRVMPLIARREFMGSAKKLDGRNGFKSGETGRMSF